MYFSFSSTKKHLLLCLKSADIFLKTARANGNDCFPKSTHFWNLIASSLVHSLKHISSSSTIWDVGLELSKASIAKFFLDLSSSIKYSRKRCWRMFQCQPQWLQGIVAIAKGYSLSKSCADKTYQQSDKLFRGRHIRCWKTKTVC